MDACPTAEGGFYTRSTTGEGGGGRTAYAYASDADARHPPNRSTTSVGGPVGVGTQEEKKEGFWGWRRRPGAKWNGMDERKQGDRYWTSCGDGSVVRTRYLPGRQEDCIFMLVEYSQVGVRGNYFL